MTRFFFALFATTCLLLAEPPKKVQFHDVPGGKPSIAKKFGKPTWLAKDKQSAFYERDGFSITLWVKESKISKLSIDAFPGNKKPKSIKDAAELLGFTEANEWKLGQKFKRGALEGHWLTNMEVGVFMIAGIPNENGIPQILVYRPGDL